MLNNIVAQLGTGAGGGGGAFESIQSITPTAGQTSVTFSSIPSTYQHLQLRLLTGRSNDTQYYYDLSMRLNSDSGSNYYQHWLYADGSSVVAGGQSATECLIGQQGGSTYFGVTIVDILDYASTTKNKTIRSFNGVDRNGSGYIGLRSNLWLSTSAINTISVQNLNATTDARFALYGIKGS